MGSCRVEMKPRKLGYHSKRPRYTRKGERARDISWMKGDSPTYRKSGSRWATAAAAATTAASLLPLSLSPREAYTNMMPVRIPGEIKSCVTRTKRQIKQEGCHFLKFYVTFFLQFCPLTYTERKSSLKKHGNFTYL